MRVEEEAAEDADVALLVGDRNLEVHVPTQTELDVVNGRVVLWKVVHSQVHVLWSCTIEVNAVICDIPHPVSVATLLLSVDFVVVVVKSSPRWHARGRWKWGIECFVELGVLFKHCMQLICDVLQVRRTGAAVVVLGALRLIGVRGDRGGLGRLAGVGVRGWLVHCCVTCVPCISVCFFRRALLSACTFIGVHFFGVLVFSFLRVSGSRSVPYLETF